MHCLPNKVRLEKSSTLRNQELNRKIIFITRSFQMTRNANQPYVNHWKKIRWNELRYDWIEIKQFTDIDESHWHVIYIRVLLEKSSVNFQNQLKCSSLYSSLSLYFWAFYCVQMNVTCSSMSLHKTLLFPTIHFWKCSEFLI